MTAERDPQLLSALVCTRDRSDVIGAAVRSLLATEESKLEIIVVDQSDGRETERALAEISRDSRVRYVRSVSRGKGAALNEGLRMAQGEVVVCTDDDCEAPPDWVAAMARVLRDQPSVAIVFCNVTAPPHDQSAGYVPTYQRSASRLLRSIVATCAGHGLGAGMALRRRVVLDMGGFDESLGPGSRFPSGDDWDITARALLRGWHVYETADLSIVHKGFRSSAQGREHARRDWIAIGAVCAKPLRAGHWRAAVVPIWELAAHALWPPFSDVLRLRRPQGLARIVGFVEGFADAWRTPIDRETLLFRTTAGRPSGRKTGSSRAAEE